MLKLALKLKFEGGLLKFQANKNDKYVIYPKRDIRTNIVLDEHNVGHYKAAANFSKIRETYYWKGMLKQIVAMINKCLVCHRNDIVAPV